MVKGNHKTSKNVLTIMNKSNINLRPLKDNVAQRYDKNKVFETSQKNCVTKDEFILFENKQGNNSICWEKCEYITPCLRIQFCRRCSVATGINLTWQDSGLVECHACRMLTTSIVRSTCFRNSIRACRIEGIRQCWKASSKKLWTN